MGSLSSPQLHLVLLLAASIAPFIAESATHWGDTQVLKELKNNLDPASVTPGSCVISWDFSVDPCDNLFSDKFTCGFRCDAVVSGTSRVTELSLDSAGYAGSLSTTWNLPYLETLDLSNNFFSGQIPESLSNLTRLARLGLSKNSFTGPIPSSIGSLSNLQELYLDNNNLQGTVPVSFNRLRNLKRLEMQFNELNGVVPNLNSLKNLYYLDVSFNAITGGFPSTLPESLVQISMRNNSLSGALESEKLRKLKYLQVVDLSSNRFNGSVPFVLFELPSLQQVTLFQRVLARGSAFFVRFGHAERGHCGRSERQRAWGASAVFLGVDAEAFVSVVGEQQVRWYDTDPVCVEDGFSRAWGGSVREASVGGKLLVRRYTQCSNGA